MLGVEGKGEGKGKGKGKQGPPPPGGKGDGKGKGKGIPFSPTPGEKGIRHPYESPPAHLVAPDGSLRLRLHNTMKSAEDTIWEGLDCWGANGTDVLEGTMLDFDRLQELWNPVQPPVQPQPVMNTALPVDFIRKAEVAVHSAKLTHELVHKALTMDISCVTSEQAYILYAQLVPVASESAAYIHMAVNRRGLDSLTATERVLWTIIQIPVAASRARIVAVQQDLDEDISHVQESIERLESVVMKLKQSRPLRTVLQTLLAVRNFLGQQGWAGYNVSSFDGVQMERIAPLTAQMADQTWLRENNPSILVLVAERLQSTHIYRCRLRFLRMITVAKVVPKDNLRKLVWSYLDDLQESPWDALSVLQDCSPTICSRELYDKFGLMARHFERILTADLAAVGVEGLAGEPGNLFSRQLQTLDVRLEHARNTCLDGCRSLGTLAKQAARLGGETRNVRDIFAAGGAVLHSLKTFGIQLRKEMETIQFHHKALALKKWQDTGAQADSCRKWPLVDTRHLCLMATHDLDIIRYLRSGVVSTQSSANAHQYASTARMQQTNRILAHYKDLVHGGIEGVYYRDPETGRWGRRKDGVDGTAPVDIMLGGPRPSA